MSSAILSYTIQPYQGTDIIAFVAGFVGLLYAALWWRDRERGMGWCALGMGLLALFYATNAHHLPTGPYVGDSPLQYAAILGLAGLGLGLVDYLDVPAESRRPAIWASLFPLVVMGAIFSATFFDVWIERRWANLTIAGWFLVMGAVCWQAARREPGAGHRSMAASLWSISLLTTVLAVTDATSILLRYWAVLPLVTLMLTLLTVGLLRRRRAVEIEVDRRSAAEAELIRLNAGLEQTVAQRTADLQDLVGGLESFNRSVSHDLRGSLGGIAGAARLADESLQRGDDSVAKRALPLIVDQAESSRRLMAALLSLAKVGDIELQRHLVDLGQLVQQVVEQLTLEHTGKPLPQIEVAAGMPWVNADPELLKPVFANLIGNAIKFTRDAASGRVEIGADNAAGVVTVHIRDNGVGFGDDAAKRLFAPFVRLHEGGFDGHGVGLSIVRRAVERHGGRVWAEGRPGQGATFHFSLPT